MPADVCAPHPTPAPGLIVISLLKCSVRLGNVVHVNYCVREVLCLRPWVVNIGKGRSWLPMKIVLALLYLLKERVSAVMEIVFPLYLLVLDEQNTVHVCSLLPYILMLSPLCHVFMGFISSSLKILVMGALHGLKCSPHVF